MEIKKSVFAMERFLILSSEFDSIPLGAGGKKLPELKVDIDFEFYETEKPNKKYIINLEAKANEGKRVPGYYFNILSRGIFNFRKNNMTVKKQREYVINSGLPLMINSVRLYIANMTSYGPYGQYSLPLIDIKDLIDKKKENDKVEK